MEKRREKKHEKAIPILNLFGNHSRNNTIELLALVSGIPIGCLKLSKLSLFFSKLFKKKYPRLQEMPTWKAIVLWMIGVCGPMILVWQLLPYLTLMIWCLMIAWIPYTVYWLLVLYFKWKDREKK